VSTLKKLQLLEQVIQLTQAMQLKADDALWDEIADIQQQRQTLFDEIFPITSTENSDEIRQILTKVVEKNNHLEKQCQQQKQTVQLQLQGLTSNKKAVNAYQTT
jgi:CRISPR/Cas system CMR-associated protein Cmr1 (group 7 of RAMP superfamily)